jgi:predicted amidophosphoribosyltransferase
VARGKPCGEAQNPRGAREKKKEGRIEEEGQNIKSEIKLKKKKKKKKVGSLDDIYRS